MELYNEAAEQPPYCDQCGTTHFDDCYDPELTRDIVVDALDEERPLTVAEVVAATNLPRRDVLWAMRDLLSYGDIQLADGTEQAWVLT